MTPVFLCGKMKISTKNHRIISEQNWKQLEINISKKFLLEEKSCKYVKKYISRWKIFEIYSNKLYN